ncbi:MAG: hypothetical protein WC678_03890 [Parcubacteria group bacterium]|jgi:hypothetical protein
MSPSPEQVNLPLVINEKKKYLTAEEMHKMWKDKKEKRFLEKEKRSVVSHENKEEITILWGPARYPLPGQYRRDTDTAERVEIYLGSDLKWRVAGKIVSDEYALSLIESDETREEYEKILKRIEELKNNLK